MLFAPNEFQFTPNEFQFELNLIMQWCTKYSTYQMKFMLNETQCGNTYTFNFETRTLNNSICNKWNSMSNETQFAKVNVHQMKLIMHQMKFNLHQIESCTKESTWNSIFYFTKFSSTMLRNFFFNDPFLKWKNFGERGHLCPPWR